jgi:oleandomycin transport system ATP-binding protein
VIDQGEVIANGTPEELKDQTGGRVLAVQPMEAERVPLVREVVAELTHAAPQVKGQLVTAPIADPAVLPAVVRRLDDAGVLVTELALRGSSLNEVFLTLTGHAAGNAEPSEEAREA